MGDQLKPIALLVMLDAIQNRVIQNREKGKRTWVFIDEIYLFFMYQYSGEYLHKCWKRYRKLNACLTGITQNIEECLLPETARMMLANSEFLIMLNQAATDRAELKEVLGLSDTQLGFVTNSPTGSGLVRVGGAVVPLINDFPKNSLYRLMSTKAGEVF